MKNTKKLLILLSAITVLIATIFSITVVAAPLISGEDTSIDEYTSKKVTEFYHFETGLQNIDLVRGDPSRAATNNARPSVNYVYSPNELSLYYLKLNYYGNGAQSNKHGFVEPTVGTLDNVEKTPVNGYVAEFDIAFFSPITVVEAVVSVPDGDDKTKEVKTTVKEPLYVFKVENGDYVFDETGNYVFETELDENGEVLMEDVYPQKTEINADGEEVPVYEAIFDENGTVIGARPVYDKTKTPTKQPVYKKQLDAEDKEILVDKVIKGTFEGLSDSESFQVQMQNDPATQEKGVVNLFTLHTVAAKKRVDIKVANQVVHSFSADQWLHVTIQYDAKTLLTYIYVGRDESTYVDSGVNVTGRKLIGTLETQGINRHAGNVTVPIYPLTFRLGSTAVIGEVAIDNFVGYQGATVHNPTLITEKTVIDKFIYIAEVLEKREIATNSYQAYTFLKTDTDMQGVLKGTSYGVDEKGNTITQITGAQKETVERLTRVYREYSSDEANIASDGIYDTMIEEVKAENVQEYLEYVKVAEQIPRLITNVQIRTQRVAFAEDFVAKLGNLIDTDSPAFDEGRRKISAIKATLEGDLAANEFVRWMNMFENSVAFGASISRLQSHYDNATALYGIITDYEEFNGLAGSEASYNSLKAAVEAYNSAAEDMKDKVNEVNSERFVFIIELMKEKTSGAWENDGTEIENLWYRAFQIIESGQFETNYDGFDAAKRVYDLAHNYFWDKLQKENIAILTEKLDSFNDPDNSYIDRAGICTYVDRYLEFNAIDIDFTNEEIINIQARNEAYKTQLETLQGDYKNLLIENTTLFINVMKMIENFSTYKDLKPLFDEATSYYYTMNIAGEGIEERVEQYRVLAEKIEAIEFDSGMFVAVVNGDLGYTALDSISDKDELYRSLTACYSCIDNLDLTYEGAESAKVVYDEKYSEYTNEINVMNSHIDEASNVAFASRGNWDIDGIVAFVKRLIDMIKE